MNNFRSTLESIRGMNARTIADYVDGIAEPDSPDSEGARMLTAARDAVLEEVDRLIGQGEMDTADDARYTVDVMRDDLGELMESVPTVMTHTIWMTYVDLCAYQTSLYDDLYGDDGADDMTRVAGLTLVLICEQIGRGILDDLEGALDDDDED